MLSIQNSFQNSFHWQWANKQARVPSHGHIPSDPVMAVGPAPSGTASRTSHKGPLWTVQDMQTEKSRKEAGGAVDFLVSGFLACPPWVSVRSGLVPAASSSWACMSWGHRHWPARLSLRSSLRAEILPWTTQEFSFFGLYVINDWDYVTRC
jgi:hypothetical protein